MTTRKIALSCVSYKWKKAVVNVRPGIKHSTWSPVGLGGMNRWQRSSLQKEKLPMVECALLVLNVGLFCSRMSEEERSVLLEKYVRNRPRERLRGLLYYPGKSSEKNGLNHPHWTKIQKRNFNGQNNSRTE